jgi:hypothetical protein
MATSKETSFEVKMIIVIGLLILFVLERSAAVHDEPTAL